MGNSGSPFLGLQQGLEIPDQVRNDEIMEFAKPSLIISKHYRKFGLIKTEISFI